GRIGRDVRGWRCNATLRTQLQFAPAGQHLSTDTELFAEPLAGSDDLIRRLAVDKEDLCDGKDQLGTIFVGHGRFSWPRTLRAGPGIGPVLASAVDLTFASVFPRGECQILSRTRINILPVSLWF